MKNKNKKPEIVGGFMRFGTKKGGLFETASAGAILTNINIENGRLYDAKFVVGNGIKDIKSHPDTNKNMEIYLPYWKEIKHKTQEICHYAPQLSYIGLDIIITDDGFKIIEINSLSALTFLPHYFPFFENEYSKEFFIEKFEERPKKFKRVLKTLDK